MDRADASTRRQALLSVGAVTLGGLAGCASVGSGAGGGPREGTASVSLLAAGSLNNALENGLRPAVTPRVETEAHGSARVARLVAEGQKDPDIVSVADVALFDAPLSPDWYAEFATNSVVVAYNPDTDGGRRLAAAGRDRWYEPLVDGEVALGRTDPDLDPLGYRALFTLELATDYYGTAVNLREAVPRRTQIYPETQLVSQFETGSIDAAIAYRNMAVERGYEYVALPPEIDLSDPAHADAYATTSYRLPDGTVVRGGPVSYAATIRHRSPAVDAVFDEHITGPYLREFGFGVPDRYPTFTGNAPDDVTH
jgi:molybdate/tungstate transport system substrate-binding protein